MRPSALTPWFASAESLNGVGPRVLALLKKALRLPPGVTDPRVIDLMWHTPTGVIDRRATPTISTAVPGTIATFELRVLKHKAPPRGSKAPHRVTCEDDTGRIDLVFFHIERKFVERQLPVGATRFVSGRVEIYGESLQMPHPDYIVAPESRADLPMLEPVYPLTAGLSGKILLRFVRQAIERRPDGLPEWQEPHWLASRHWPSFDEAIRRLHAPTTPEDTSPGSAGWQRLAYDELLAGQVALALMRQSIKSRRGRALIGDGRLRERLLAALPFSLTLSQRTALAEIEQDLAAPMRMLRLLQGDVGSGKTAVALIAMAIAVEAGSQAALMAPTEILARQHLETIAPLADSSGLRVGLLTGREKGKARAEVLGRLAAGDIDILIGTHAIFQSDVSFRDLALAVIDEQHRFGVHQRLALQKKEGQAGGDVLVMTATPIPRTLMMTHYGDLDVSRLTEKPAGRKPVITTLASLDRMEDLVDGLRRALSEGAQVYWVCPLIESSAVTELSAAAERHAHLTQTFGDTVGLLHGAMAGRVKDTTMAAFAEGKLRVLVSTTVVEVGVNVPNATIMVIEHAERFGLAQLHQLRGRVGRGSRQSYCVLLYKPPLGETAEARLKMMRDTEDGFLIAEKDLELRGGGEVLGARQSGMPEFRVAGVPGFEELLAAARDDARLLLNNDPDLTGARGRAIRTLLYLFECDEAVKLFRAP